jgi:hypothetical protein
MRLFVAGEEYVIEQRTDLLKTVFDIIHQVMEKHSLIFCGLRIDGEEYFDRFDEVFAEKSGSIRVVEACVMTEEQIVKDTMESILEYMSSSLPLLRSLVEEFYSHSVSSESWVQLGQLVEGLQWIQRAAAVISDLQGRINFAEEVGALGTAISHQDNTMIGDIIQYEIIPRYESVLAYFTNHRNEVKEHNVN